MAKIEDQDRFFSGQLRASLPKHLIAEGEIARLINGRFVEGAITNAIGFDELEISYAKGNDTLISGGNTTYGDLLQRGDIQLVAPLDNVAGQFLVAVISGLLFLIDLETNLAYDITPKDSFLTDKSLTNFPLSYLDNDGGVYGAGGYLVIFNYPNRPIFVNQNGARLSNASNYEMPPARLGATGGNRAAVISSNDLMYASDPLGGASSLAPLTFEETLDPGATFFGDIYTIGSALDNEKVTAIFRMPRLLGSAQDFLAQSLLVSTETKKYIVAIGAARDDWDNIEFITYGGTSEGAAGPLAGTNIGSAVVYTSNTGRIKTFAQDHDREQSLVETYFDEDLGQYLCCYESNFYFRPWYRTLNHSRSIVKFNNDKLYATVYPFYAEGINKFNQSQQSFSHRALAVGSLSSDTRIGPQAAIAWEGFYDWFNPTSLVTMGTDTYIVSKEPYGRIRFYKENFQKVDDHLTTIVTRGYFGNVGSKSKSLLDIHFYFRRLTGKVKLNISYLIDNKWVCGAVCETDKKLTRINLRNTKCKTNSWSIPIKIEIDHKECVFELESIRVMGESHEEEK